MSTPFHHDVSDPAWMPLGYDVASDRFRFVMVEEGMLSEASFLDQRLGKVWEDAMWVRACELEGKSPPATPAWLFHTAFCCSTLLARALHSPPWAMAIKEPSVLLDLAFLSLRGPSVSALLADRVGAAVRTLARPRYPGEGILIKPTNAANRLLPALIAETPDSKALLLYSSLENFLMSCVKKLPGAEEPMRWMAGYLLPGTRLEKALGIPDCRKLNFIEACVVTWFAQMEIYAQALSTDHGERLRSLDMQVLLRQPLQSVMASAEWLGLAGAEAAAERETRIAAVFSRNSKQASATYNPEKRSEERTAIMDRYGDLVRAALAWSEKAVAPFATLPSDWKPLSP
jgi:hypothetical protein